MSCIELVSAAILFLNPTWDEDRTSLHAGPICVSAEKRDIDPLILVSIVQHETGWRKKTIRKNEKGSVDYGLMQFNCPVGPDMAWRDWWCSPIRRKRLMTVKGNISAGSLELSFWRKACKRKEGREDIYLNPLCGDCFLSSVGSAGMGRITSFNMNRETLKGLIKSHWWVGHYNFGSKKYDLRVLFVYKALLTGGDDIYRMVRDRYYVKMRSRRSLGRCLLRDDLCVEEYKKWRRRQNSKTR